MKNICEALRESHDKQRHLLEALSNPPRDGDKQEELFAALKAELKHHEAAEERYFYVPLMEYDETQKIARHSVAEHQDIDEVLETLEQTDYSSPDWATAAKKLQHLVIHHLDEEEQEVFQFAGRVLSDQDKTDLARNYDQMMEKLAG